MDLEFESRIESEEPLALESDANLLYELTSSPRLWLKSVFFVPSFFAVKIERNVKIGLCLIGGVCLVLYLYPAVISHVVKFGFAFGFTLFLDILAMVSLVKDPTQSYPTAMMHCLLYQYTIFMGLFYTLRQMLEVYNIKRVQDNVLSEIIQLNGETDYGRCYQLTEVKTREDFVKYHPLTRQDHYAEYVERMMAGEENVLTWDHVAYYSVSSGTSEKSQSIPVTGRALSTQFPIRSMAARHASNQLPIVVRFQRRMRLYYNPRRAITKTACGVYVGPLSAYIQQSFRAQQDVFTTPPKGFQIPDFAATEYVHVLFGLRDRYLACIEGSYISLVYLALRTLEMNWREMCYDIRKGTLNPSLTIPNGIRRALVEYLPPMPDRARELEREFEEGFDNIVARIWPYMTLICAISSGPFQQYATLIKDKFAKTVKIFTPYYTSTKGIIGYNNWPGNNNEKDVRFLLAAGTMFFEFLPLDRADDLDPVTLFADQVDSMQEYELIITNYSGLYRYRLGDIVRVVDFYGQYPIIQFVRSSRQLSIHGEKTPENVLVSGVSHLNKTFSARLDFIRIRDFSSCESVLVTEKSVFGKHGRFTRHFFIRSPEDGLRTVKVPMTAPFYVIFLELHGLIEHDRQKLENELGTELDNYLMETQSDGYGYKYQREKGGLGPAKVVIVESGAFKHLREFMINSSTTSPTQLKIPRILVKSSWADFLCQAGLVRPYSKRLKYEKVHLHPSG